MFIYIFVILFSKMNIILVSLFSYLICVEYINCDQNKILTGTVTYNNSSEQIEPNSIAYIIFDDVSIADGSARKIGNLVFFFFKIKLFKYVL